MARWLFKEEPTEYSFADLVRDGKTTWSGISNALALKNLRQCKPGDKVFFYHTGKEKAVVGIMVVTRGHEPQGDGDKNVTVEVEPVKALKNPVSLARIKSEERLSGWDLVRMSRLSVMPVTPDQWKIVEELAREPG